jgi:hypothetical protein
MEWAAYLFLFYVVVKQVVKVVFTGKRLAYYGLALLTNGLGKGYDVISNTINGSFTLESHLALVCAFL